MIKIEDWKLTYKVVFVIGLIYILGLTIYFIFLLGIKIPSIYDF